MIRDAGTPGIHQTAATSYRDGIIKDMLGIVDDPALVGAPIRMRRCSALDIVIACDDYASAKSYQGITSIGLSRAAGHSERRIRAAFASGLHSRR
jgi:hypothetical protein